MHEGGSTLSKTLLNAAAKEIAEGLAPGMRREGPATDPTAQVVDILLERLSTNVAGLLRQAELRGVSGPTASGLQRSASHRDLVDGAAGGEATGGTFPNLKYAKPKYQNMESVLKYIEQAQDTGGFKLVIMNFND